MESLWFAVFVVIVGFSVQMNLILAGGLFDCEYYQYMTKDDSQCRICPACPAGQMYTKHCGFEEKNGVITKVHKGCTACPLNKYKNERSIYECDECTNTKCPGGKDMIHPCNKTHDLKCSKCKKGFYTAPGGSCLPCSLCCGKIPKDKIYLIKECEDAGMGRCSCRPLQDCVDKKGTCNRPLTTAIPFQRKTLPSTPTMPSRVRNQKTQRKNSKRNQRLPDTKKNSTLCSNNIILRQLRRLLSKYKGRIVLKISVEVKDRKKRKGRRKARKNVFSVQQGRRVTRRSRD